MFLADTDVIWQATKQQPHEGAMAWLQSTAAESVFLSAVTIHEVRLGAERLPPGRKRGMVEQWIERDVMEAFSGRILPVDVAVADLCGRMVAQAMLGRHTPSLDDALIAATARLHGLKVATLNRSHFEKFGVELVDL